MNIKVSGFKIQLKTRNYFDSDIFEIDDDSYGETDHMIFESLESFAVPDCHACIYEDDVSLITIYKESAKFYLAIKDVLLAQIYIVGKIVRVWLNRNISDAALQEITIKKIFPIFCYNTYAALPLHATGVFKDRLLLSFTGYSTSGKSTLAASFIYDGLFNLISDDIMFLFYENNKIFIYPTKSELKLRDDVRPHFLNKLSTTKSSIITSKGKIQISSIILLDQEFSESINLQRLTSNKHKIILQSLYAGGLCNYSSDFLKYMFNMTNVLDIWRLSYPRNLSILENVKEKLISTFS